MSDNEHTPRPGSTPRTRRDSGRTSVPLAGERESGAITYERGELHRLLVESVEDYAIFALDPRGFILSWNAGAERCKGYTSDEAIGQHFSIFYPEHLVAEGFPEHELRTAAAEGRFEDEGWRIRKDGSRFWANVVITALHDDVGTLLGYAKVTRDLTERRAAEQRALEAAGRVAAEAAGRRDAEEARQRADEANRTKSEFLAAMSHELRTPLNAIGGFTDLITMGLSGPVTEQQREQLGRIKRSQTNLLGIINDILNFSRVEGGHVTYDSAAVALRDVADWSMQTIGPQAVAREIVFDDADCDANTMAWADRAKVEQIVLNLLSNAMKFTAAGGRVSVSCRSAPDGYAAIVVRDTGIGIPADQLDRIFEPFVQVGRSLTTKQEGAGLGLAISRELARAMHGDITVESTPDRGSTFTLTLPQSPHE